jgi:hypothetical protein
MHTGLYDCCSGEFHVVEKYPYIVGSARDVDLKIIGASVQGKQCQIQQKGVANVVVSFVPGGVRINDQEIGGAGAALQQNQDYPIQIGVRCFYIRHSSDLKSWGERLKIGGWKVLREGQIIGNQSMPLQNLLDQFKEPNSGNGVMLIKDNANGGFSVDALRNSNQEYLQDKSLSVGGIADGQNDSLPEKPPQRKPTDGEYRCPYCWWPFDAKDFFYVAKHPALQNDPLLGSSEYLRFKPNRWEDGKPLDPKGEICDELACPDCHSKLPRSMKNTKQHIISVVGDAASGKSYFLSVNTKILSDSFPQFFDVLFEDSTPGGNDVLRRMVNSLYGATTPDQVNIVKTQLYSNSYSMLKSKSKNREVSMPKAFIFHVSKLKNKECRANLVFYDNAGEHFRPENDSVETPGAQHVAAASGIIFLFDPFNHIDFKRAISKQKTDDPQFNQPTEDFVTVILSELRKRIEQINDTDKLKAPLAFVVGKYDAWHQLVPEGEGFWEPREEGVLNFSAIKHNSDLTRTVLRKISPGLVAQAEALSENTMFFPVSNFGVPPVTHKNERGETFIVPDPQKLNPMFADIPVLWLNSQFNPDLVPIR